MAPSGVFRRPKGEQVIVHRCLGCGFERYNRIAADDDPAGILALPVVLSRSRPMGNEEIVSYLEVAEE